MRWLKSILLISGLGLICDGAAYAAASPPPKGHSKCPEGQVWTKDCGCVPSDYKCCTAAEKAAAEQTCQNAIVQSEITYADELERISAFYRQIRTDARVDRENTVNAANAAYESWRAFCASGYDQDSALGALGYTLCIASGYAVCNDTIAGAWAFYLERVTMANSMELVDSLQAGSENGARCSDALHTKARACDNW